MNLTPSIYAPVLLLFAALAWAGVKGLRSNRARVENIRTKIRIGMRALPFLACNLNSLGSKKLGSILDSSFSNNYAIK
jgi:hypothetical protein